MNNAAWLIGTPAAERRGRPTTGLFGVRTGRRDELTVERAGSAVDAADQLRFIIPRDFAGVSAASALDIAR